MKFTIHVLGSDDINVRFRTKLIDPSIRSCFRTTTTNGWVIISSCQPQLIIHDSLAEGVGLAYICGSNIYADDLVLDCPIALWEGLRDAFIQAEGYIIDESTNIFLSRYLAITEDENFNAIKENKSDIKLTSLINMRITRIE
jgi:hypothetical protein